MFDEIKRLYEKDCMLYEKEQKKCFLLLSVGIRKQRLFQNSKME